MRFLTPSIEVAGRFISPSGASINQIIRRIDDLLNILRVHLSELLVQSLRLKLVSEPCFAELMPAGEGGKVQMGNAQGWRRVGSKDLAPIPWVTSLVGMG